VATVSTVSTASSVSAKILHAWLGTEKKSERIPLRALLSGNNNLTACICNLCDEWANLAALQMQMATEGSPKITPLSRFSPFEL